MHACDSNHSHYIQDLVCFQVSCLLGEPLIIRRNKMSTYLWLISIVASFEERQSSTSIAIPKGANSRKSIPMVHSSLPTSAYV